MKSALILLNAPVSDAAAKMFAEPDRLDTEGDAAGGAGALGDTDGEADALGVADADAVTVGVGVAVAVTVTAGVTVSVTVGVGVAEAVGDELVFHRVAAAGRGDHSDAGDEGEAVPQSCGRAHDETVSFLCRDYCPDGSSMTTLVDFTDATATIPGWRSSSSAASRVMSETRRNGPACISTWAATPSFVTLVMIPVRWFRAD